VDISVDDAAILRGCQDDIRFDRARRINDHAGPEPAIMPYRAPDHRAVGNI
jgi:hypothetical protein